MLLETIRLHAKEQNKKIMINNLRNGTKNQNLNDSLDALIHS